MFGRISKLKGLYCKHILGNIERSAANIQENLRCQNLEKIVATFIE